MDRSQARARAAAAAGEAFSGVAVFSGTLADERAALGGRIEEWLVRHPARRVVDTVVVQSSCRSFHCLTIVLFYREA